MGVRRSREKSRFAGGARSVLSYLGFSTAGPFSSRYAASRLAFAHHLRDLADTLFTGENASFVAQLRSSRAFQVALGARFPEKRRAAVCRLGVTPTGTQ